MVAKPFDLEREVQKTFVELRRQRVKQDRSAAAQQPNMRAARALRRKQAAALAEDEPKLLAQAREIANHRLDLFLMAEDVRARRQRNMVIREAEYQAQKAADAAKRAVQKAEEAERLAERTRRRERRRLVVTIPDDA